MGKFSNKAKSKPSKRKTLKQRYKIERKVKEHKKKTRRTARKLRATGIRRGGKKQHALPNMFPFKTEVLQAVKMERKDQQRLLRQKQNKPDNSEMEQEQAQEIIYEKNKKWFKDIDGLIESSDVILEVLDARDPQGCRNKQLEQRITKQFNKPLILVINKIDLIGFQHAAQWIKHMEYPTVLYRSLQNTQIKGNPVQFGQGALLHQIRSIITDQNVVVGVIGLPGVGKSTFINSIRDIHNTIPIERNECVEVKFDRKIRVLDAVGIIQAQTQNIPLILQMDNISEQQVQNILRNASHEQLSEIYKIASFKGVSDFLQKVAKANGLLLKGGVPDKRKAVQRVCRDWIQQRIDFSVVPK